MIYVEVLSRDKRYIKLKNINLDMKKEEVISIIPLNGCGNIIAGFEKKSSGAR